MKRGRPVRRSKNGPERKIPAWMCIQGIPDLLNRNFGVYFKQFTFCILQFFIKKRKDMTYDKRHLLCNHQKEFW